MISLNLNGNVIIQPDDNVNFIILPEKNMDVQDNVIIQPDENIYFLQMITQVFKSILSSV
jgi:hypothetical protein